MNSSVNMADRHDPVEHACGQRVPGDRSGTSAAIAAGTSAANCLGFAKYRRNMA